MGFSPNFKFKICQKIKINQSKVINCYVLGDFCLANFKFLTDFKFKIRWEIRSKDLKQGWPKNKFLWPKLGSKVSDFSIFWVYFVRFLSSGGPKSQYFWQYFKIAAQRQIWVDHTWPKSTKNTINIKAPQSNVKVEICPKSP